MNRNISGGTLRNGSPPPRRSPRFRLAPQYADAPTAPAGFSMPAAAGVGPLPITPASTARVSQSAHPEQPHGIPDPQPPSARRTTPVADIITTGLPTAEWERITEDQVARLVRFVFARILDVASFHRPATRARS
ncbi:hypothetical protein GCM10010430_58640 [Kitasatospora cystarginea]|uniref:Uncharacterized protein n=1 Tax=Kitasatospora cystarginea TaxID=58350 RepID=A0ABN3EPQ1_9ACTN